MASEAACVTRIVTVGTDGVPRCAALAARRGASRRCTSAIGSTFELRHRLRRRRPGRAPRPRRAREVRRDRRDRLRLLPRLRALRADQERAFRGADRARARDREAARDPHACGRAMTTLVDVARRAAPARPASDPPLLLDARPPAGGCLAHAELVDLVCRQRHLPEGRPICAGRRCASRARASAGRDRRAVSVAAGGPGNSRTQPRERRPRPRGPLAVERRVSYEELDRALEERCGPPRVFGW